jgi:hypothetical protein
VNSRPSWAAAMLPICAWFSPAKVGSSEAQEAGRAHLSTLRCREPGDD